MKRREFITLVGGAAVAWPMVVRAQQPAMPVIGFLHSGSPDQNIKRLEAFRKGLNQEGFVEGKNVTIEYRWAAGQNEKLPAMATDLVRQQTRFKPSSQRSFLPSLLLHQKPQLAFASPTSSLAWS